MKNILDLSNCFLIATDKLSETFFERTVVYVHDQSEEGSTGIVINRSIDKPFRELFAKVDLPEDDITDDIPILLGGPVSLSNGFILYRKDAAMTNSPEELDQVSLSLSHDMLVKISQGIGPRQCLVVIGICGWDDGQLEEEIADNFWLVAPYDERILFDVPYEDRYDETLKLLGISGSTLLGEEGNA